MPKLAVLASGEGTLLEAIRKYPLKVDLVIVDRECRAYDIALKAGIPVHHIPRAAYAPLTVEESRDRFSRDVAQVLYGYGRGDVAAMAGFRTILSSAFFVRFHGTLLNVHPSLLPDFRGPDAVRQALEAEAEETGCTVHVATETVDHGRIIARERIKVWPGDTVDRLHARIKAVERVIYPQAIHKILAGRYTPPSR